MSTGTIWRTRDCTVRHAGSTCRTRDTQRADPPDGSQSCGSGRDAGATREYQSDSSSKRPVLSVVLDLPDPGTRAAAPRGGRQENHYRLT